MIRYTPAQAQSLGLLPTPPVRRGRKTHTADGHAIDPAFLAWTEHDFQVEVKKLLARHGWTCGLKDVDELPGLAFHAAHVMSQAEKGWPDWVAIRRRDRRLLFFELKRENGELSERQAAVLDLLRCVRSPGDAVNGVPRVQVLVWRPSDMPAIVEVLR
jgi:hypothetical protein